MTLIYKLDLYILEMYLDTKMNFLCQSFKIYSITDIKNNDE